MTLSDDYETNVKYEDAQWPIKERVVYYSNKYVRNVTSFRKYVRV
jgi:hypothetical protein